MKSHHMTAMKQYIESASPEALCFAIMNAMSDELSPLIQLLQG
jgi:hypothetical protein